METLEHIGIKLFWLHCINISCENLSLFFCLFKLYSASDNALQNVFSDGSYESTAKLELVKFSEKTVCWCLFNWGICKQNGYFVRFIHSSSCHGSLHTQIMRRRHHLRGIVAGNQN